MLIETLIFYCKVLKSKKVENENQKNNLNSENNSTDHQSSYGYSYLNKF